MSIKTCEHYSHEFYENKKGKLQRLSFNYHHAKAICLGTIIKILDTGEVLKHLNQSDLKYQYSFQQAWKPKERRLLFKRYHLTINM